jgi:hypothetical protein
VTWFRAMWWLTSQKNGASALGLKRVLGFGSYQTAWAWLHKLRRAMVRPDRERLGGVVEVDVSKGVRTRHVTRFGALAALRVASVHFPHCCARAVRQPCPRAPARVGPGTLWRGGGNGAVRDISGCEFKTEPPRIRPGRGRPRR